MGKLLKNKPVLLSLLLFGVLGVIIILILSVGKAYQGGLLNIVSPQTNSDIKTVKKKNIKKITIRKPDEVGCMEVTSDGVVRVYTVCGEELQEASRLTNTRDITKLFKIVSEQDLSKNKGKIVYQLIIESDEGTQIVYVAQEDMGGVDDIVDIIENIEEELPQPSPSTIPPVPSPTPGTTPVPTPSPGVTPIPSPSVSPMPTGPPETFTCDFSESGNKKKPYNVSNVICSTEPSPVP